MTTPRRDFRAHVREVQEALAEGVARAGLGDDGYGAITEAQSAALGILPEFVDEVRAAQPQFTPDQIRRMTTDIGSRLLARSRLFERAFNWRTGLYIALAVVLLAGGLVSGGMFAYARGYAAAEATLIKAPELSTALAASDATSWRVLIENNPSVASARRDCAVQDGRRACYFALWIDAAGPAPVISTVGLAGDPLTAEGKAPVKPHK